MCLSHSPSPKLTVTYNKWLISNPVTPPPRIPTFPVIDYSPSLQIPEGAVTLIMPHVYLGKFMMNRAEFESKYGVRLTTNSKDGGYLIIITGWFHYCHVAVITLGWYHYRVVSLYNILQQRITYHVKNRWNGVQKYCLLWNDHAIFLLWMGF